MTREEAIEIVNKGKCPYPVSLKEKEKNEAFDMAISALSEELSEDGTLTVHVSDGSKVKRVFVMGDNIFGGLYYPDSAETDTAKPESDLISRTQAINDYAQCFADEYGMDCGEMFVGVLHQCPTFPNSSEIKGEWVSVVDSYHEDGTPFESHWECSKCGSDSSGWGKFKFCPDCGADMRGGKDK